MKMLEQELYNTSSLKYLSASVFYTSDLPPMGPGGFGVLPNGKGFKSPNFDPPMFGAPTQIGQGESGFVKSSELGLGPGISRTRLDLSGMIERIRAPGFGDDKDSGHLNFEYRIPGIKKPLTNIHISLDRDEED